MTLKENNLSDNIIDISLRPEHVGAMSLEAEVVEVKRRETLERYGATDAEIEFLAPNYGDCQRVGLNAMTSRQIVDFVAARPARRGKGRAGKAGIAATCAALA
jgi:hypothetical protein